MNLGVAIKSIRKKLNITQFDLAEKCNISQTSLSQIETGLKRPSSKTLKKICDVLDVPESVVYILAMQETDVPSSKASIYNMLFPSIKSLALQIVGNEYLEPVISRRVESAVA
ncbi:MAG: helix-turn-helix transcriptional regulator [Bacteroidetes bacterium]|nr:helix-turn-helix transcriptional regulator [Bacteroidota bacterium]